MTDTTPEAHTYEWQTSNTFTEDETSCSPVSRLDHSVRTNTLIVRSCSCGSIQRVLVSYGGEWRWLNRREQP